MSSVLVPTLLRGLSDRLPNVRLTAARVADDIVSVAAMSAWPPPEGRSATKPAVVESGIRSAVIDPVETRESGGSSGGECFGSEPAVGETRGNGDVVVRAAGQVDGSVSVSVDGQRGDSGDGGGGRGWGCGWASVETRLEELSRQDGDGDVAFFAKQALKPRWQSDCSR